MYIIAGLGNPGLKYEGTRHNIGFETIDYISAVYNIPIKKLGFKALFGQGIIGGEKVILAKPQTFMNLSGESLKPMLDYYKLPPSNLFVIYDDVNLATGALRIRPSGSDGGHNGMKSIIYMLNSDAFPRIRIGIGSKPNPHMDLADYVLGSFSKEEIELLSDTAKQIVKAVPVMMKEGISAAMSKYNGKIQK